MVRALKWWYGWVSFENFWSTNNGNCRLCESQFSGAVVRGSVRETQRRPIAPKFFKKSRVGLTHQDHNSKNVFAMCEKGIRLSSHGWISRAGLILPSTPISSINCNEIMLPWSWPIRASIRVHPQDGCSSRCWRWRLLKLQTELLAERQRDGIDAARKNGKLFWAVANHWQKRRHCYCDNYGPRGRPSPPYKNDLRWERQQYIVICKPETELS